MGACGRAHPSFGMTPTFREYDLWGQKTQILTIWCHTKRGMRAAMRAPSFFCYGNDKDLKVCFLVICVIYKEIWGMSQNCSWQFWWNNSLLQEEQEVCQRWGIFISSYSLTHCKKSRHIIDFIIICCILGDLFFLSSDSYTKWDTRTN